MIQSSSQSAGFVIGILAGLVLAVLLIKFANTNRRAKTQYDERQKEIRGRAYQIAFYTLAGYEAVLFLLAFCGVRFPAEYGLTHFAGILLGGTVLACYCIWHDVYWGLNNDRKRYLIIFLVAGIFNAIPVIGALTHGGLMENGVFSTAVINLMVLIMMVVISAMLLVKHLLDRREVES